MLPLLRCLTLILLLFCFSQELYPLENNFFESNSKLAEGKWVKIRVRENGIYQISYEQLKEMGFTDMQNIGIYGTGGALRSEDFTSRIDGDYIDDLPPVAIMHIDNKIYFYGQGPVKVRYRSEFANSYDRKFERESINTYSEYGYYFITEGRDDIYLIEDATGEFDESLPDVTECYDYFYHEVEKSSIAHSGRLFLGESFVDEDRRVQKIAYNIPGAINGGSTSLECRFYANNPYGSKVQFGLSEDRLFEASVNFPAENYYSRLATPISSMFNLNTSRGEITVKYAPSGTPAQANLDYLLLGAKKSIGFHDNQRQFKAYISDYNPKEHGAIVIKNGTPKVVVWDIENSNAVKNLPYTYTPYKQFVKHLTPAKREGVMIAFDSSKRQYSVDWHEEVDNQNLHAITADEVPHMLIITLPFLYEKAEELADIHRLHDKIDVMVVTSEKIINEFSAGTPDAMAYRAFCKMLYDRNPTKFRNLLLFGEMHYDNRQLNASEKREMLLSYQTEESINSVMTFCISDFYGMLEDTPDSNGMQYDIVNIGVGELPCRSEAEAELIIEKVARYIVDTSYPYWLGNMQVIGDGPDNNEHLNQSEMLASEIKGMTNDEYCINKIYISAYDQSDVSKKFIDNLSEGIIYGTYLGHANTTSLSSDMSLWKNQYTRRLNNPRLSFMSFGACTVTPLDAGIRGSTEAMLFKSKYGLIGGIMSSRTAYSYWNYRLLSATSQSLLQEEQSDNTEVDLSKPRKSSRQTIGEIYAKAKSNMQVPHSNEFTYHLVCDPAIVLPIATTSIESEIITEQSDDGGLPILFPGNICKIRGKVTDRAGNHLTDINASLVARLFDYPHTLNTNGYNGSPAIDIEYDETILCTIADSISNGEFEIELFIPRNIVVQAEKPLSIRLSSYDSESRIASLGKVDFILNPAEEDMMLSDEEAPTIDNIYLNSSDFNDGDFVNINPILYAEISDNLGLAFHNNGFDSNINISIDGTTGHFNIAEHCTLTNNGRKCMLTYPIENLSIGEHTITLNIYDVAGNHSSRNISFHIYANYINGELTISDTPLRTGTYISVNQHNETPNSTTYTFIITDSHGETVYKSNTTSNQIYWEGSNNDGDRVKAGIYQVYCKIDGGGIFKGVTPVEEIIVLKEKSTD